MEIAGVDSELIDWSSTRRQRIEDVLEGLTYKFAEKHGRLPGERARNGLGWQAAQDTRPEKKTPRPLKQLLAWWRASARISAFARLMVRPERTLVEDPARAPGPCHAQRAGMPCSPRRSRPPPFRPISRLRCPRSTWRWRRANFPRTVETTAATSTAASTASTCGTAARALRLQPAP
ncbi:relaxase domain-containing protein [Streptomyces sp. NPDC003753]